MATDRTWQAPGRSLIGLVVCAACVAAEPWPAEAKEAAQMLTPLHEGLRREVSDCFWNSETGLLWVSAAGKQRQGSWAFRYDRAGQRFVMAGSWPKQVDCDEGIAQAGLAEVKPGVHRVFVLIEKKGAIRESLRTLPDGATPGRSWAITELGNDRSEGLTFIPDAWLAAADFRTAAGEAYPASGGGLGGIFLVGRQDGTIHAVDLDTRKDGGYRHLGVFVMPGKPISVSALAFDRSIGRLYVHQDDESLAVSDLRARPEADGRAALERLALFREPANRGGSGAEGFACAPFLGADGKRNPDRFAWLCHDIEDGDGADALQWYRAFQPEAGGAWRVQVLAGDAQTGAPGKPLPGRIRVRVADGRGYPLIGAQVTCTAAHGRIEVQRAVVGGGDLWLTWTLGAATGPQEATIVVAGAGEVRITAQAR